MKLVTKDLLFVVFAAAVLAVVILVSGKETTKKMPDDAAHRTTYDVLKKSGSRKEAERGCGNCHNEKMNPLPAHHPPKDRCLFCHKIERTAR
ncbi:MAG: cytochrome C [Geobacteraceae bacterium]|nr:cytochrome C [Geobacteraceae bacterium]